MGSSRQANLKPVTSEEADFHGSDLRGALLKGCQFKNVDMTEAKLEGADFRGSSVEGLVANAADLKGAIVDPAQAIKLCRSHGAEDSLSLGSVSKGGSAAA
ncbi:MAG: pentapeptide repeat-containing protein [Candidatus Angelobacter sp.]